MSTSASAIVKQFYAADIFKDSSIMMKCLHPEMQLFWNARTGFSQLNREQVYNTISEAGKSFESVRCEISHLLEDNGQVTVRFTYFVRTIENVNEEIPMAHFIAIWEIKDGLMYKGYKISQPAEENEEALASYTEN